MVGLDPQRLVLVNWTTPADKQTGEFAKNCVGTGYFVPSDLILTAAHVVPDDLETPISIRVEGGEPRWRYNAKVKWRDDALDAALILVSPPLAPELETVKWGEFLPNENSTWNSTGYPEAAIKPAAIGGLDRKSAGLQGTLYVGGGGGRGLRN